MGQTKAGKTTLYYYLLGKKLIREENELGVWQMRPEINYFIAHIGNGYDSTTVYPNIPIGSSESGVMVIDMPGNTFLT
jgi:GTPase SAR1 family protein